VKTNNPAPTEKNAFRLVGVLPLVHLKHLLFGNKLVSMPFFDLGGILADNQDIERALLSEAIKQARSLKAETIELRHIEPLKSFSNTNKQEVMGSNGNH
jgi:serine/alanine adding enzyme